jgi:tetratricopeptide (TPR) repeat protein
VKKLCVIAVLLVFGLVSGLAANGIVERDGQAYDLDMLNALYALEYVRAGSFAIDEPVIIAPKTHDNATFKEGVWYWGVPGMVRAARTLYAGSTLQFTLQTWENSGEEQIGDEEQLPKWLKARYSGEPLTVTPEQLYTLVGTFSFVEGKAAITFKYIEPFDESLYFDNFSGYADKEDGEDDTNADIAYYKALLEDDPDNATAHNNLAYTYALNGEPEAALPHITRAMELVTDPDTLPVFLDTRGYVYFLLGRYDEALADYNSALSHPAYSDANAAETYYHRSRVYADKARADLHKALELNPSYDEAAQKLQDLGAD